MRRLLERLATGRPLRIPELADYVGCSRSYLHKLADAGALQVGRIGRCYTVNVEEAERIAKETGVLRE